MATCYYDYEKSKSLPVTSAHALQYSCFSSTAKYLVWRILHYASKNSHFLAIFMLISVFFFLKSSLKIRFFIATEFIINYDRIVLRYNLVLIFTAWVYSIVKTQSNHDLILV